RGNHCRRRGTSRQPKTKSRRQGDEQNAKNPGPQNNDGDKKAQKSQKIALLHLWPMTNRVVGSCIPTPDNQQTYEEWQNSYCSDYCAARRGGEHRCFRSYRQWRSVGSEEKEVCNAARDSHDRAFKRVAGVCCCGSKKC